MTAWQIYWMLQLDSISIGISIIAFAFLAIFVWQIVFFINAKIDEGWSDSDKELVKKRKIALSYIWWVAPVIYLISCLVPSTKTIAAIYVLPKILKGDTIETVAKDGADIYRLGIDRLKEILEEPKSK